MLLPDGVRDLVSSVTVTGDRSEDEFAITVALYNAGYDQAAAWSAVRSIGGHSAARGFSWWLRYSWSQISPKTVEGQPQGIDAAKLITPALGAARVLYGSMGTRQRHTVETVGWALLERLTATLSEDDNQEQPVVGDADSDQLRARSCPGGSWVHMSERDLELATGRTRSAIRAALAWLVGHGVVERQQHDRADYANRWRIGPIARQALTDPPLLTPPALPSPAISTWAPQSSPGTASAATGPPARHSRGHPPQHPPAPAPPDGPHRRNDRRPLHSAPDSSGRHRRLGRSVGPDHPRA